MPKIFTVREVFPESLKIRVSSKIGASRCVRLVSVIRAEKET